MFPSIPVMSRRINGDSNVIVDGYKVPSGTNVIMLNYQLHQDDTKFENPELFIPERFENPQQNYTYLPFSAGPRNCIGQR